MLYLKSKKEYSKNELKEIEYGLISIYITTTKIIFILVLSYFLGNIKEVLVFMLLFNILRTTAFGLHATKSWICWISSTTIFIGIPLLCKILNINIYIKILICLIQIIFIRKNAPADTKKRPIVNLKRRKIYKTISTISSIVFSIICISTKNNFISNALMLAMILENILISPLTYKLFKLPYNNYIDFLKNHPNFSN